MRNLGLDILRLVAVILVLGRHLRLPEIENAFLNVWRTGGWVGVDLFFVLSGFLVSGLIFREFLRKRKVDIKRFLIRRGFKIYPAFYAMLIFTVSVRWIGGQSVGVQPLTGEILFLQNYLGGVWNHTWSLAVEEHFYIGMAILCFFALRHAARSKQPQKPFQIIPITFLIVAIVCLSFRVGNLLLIESYSHQKFMFGTHLRIDSLMFGVLLSYLWHFHGLEARIANIKTSLLIMAGLALLSPAFIFPLEKFKAVSVFGVILFYLGSGALVLAAVRLKGTQSRTFALCGALGAASYSIYLWHMPVATWGWTLVSKLTGADGYHWYFSFYMVGSLVFGWMMSKVIEWPVLKLRDRLFPTVGERTIGNDPTHAAAARAVPEI